MAAVKKQERCVCLNVTEKVLELRIPPINFQHPGLSGPCTPLKDIQSFRCSSILRSMQHPGPGDPLQCIAGAQQSGNDFRTLIREHSSD